MDELLSKVAADPFADLVLPGFIKFFGKKIKRLSCDQNLHTGALNAKGCN
jgi:hypothetical protein